MQKALSEVETEIVFLYLVYRLIKFLQPKEVRQEEQRILSHRFYKVSGRGRASSVFPALYPGEDPEYEDEAYKGYCTWGRDNTGISIVYWQDN